VLERYSTAVGINHDRVDQHFGSQADATRRAVGRRTKELGWFSTQMAKGFIDIAISQIGKQLQGIEQIALAGSVAAKHDGERLKLDIELFEGLEPIDLQSGQHPRFLSCRSKRGGHAKCPSHLSHASMRSSECSIGSDTSRACVLSSCDASETRTQLGEQRTLPGPNERCKSRSCRHEREIPSQDNQVECQTR